MPLNTSECIDVDMACSMLYAYGEHLRCEAMCALDQCFVSGSCRDSIRSYLSMGAGDDGIADSLIVVVRPMIPTSGTATVGPSVWQLQFDIILRESGYPMAQVAEAGRAISPPDPEAQHRATMQLMSHGEAIHRRLSALKASGCLAPDGYRCTRGQISQLAPLPVQGGVAGWTISVVLIVPWA